MFELLVAVFVIGVTLAALVGLVTQSISNSNFSRQRTQASKATNAAVEWLRKERDDGWVAFTAHGGGPPGGNTYCLKDLTWTAGNCGANEYITGTVFIREASLIYSPSNPDQVEARVSTTWTDSAGQHESRISTYFSDWRTK